MKFKENNGFTFIEMIVVVTILGIVISMGMPKIIGLVDDTSTTVNKHNLKNLHSRLAQYKMDHPDVVYPMNMTEINNMDLDLADYGVENMSVAEHGQHYVIKAGEYVLNTGDISDNTYTEEVNSLYNPTEIYAK